MDLNIFVKRLKNDNGYIIIIIWSNHDKEIDNIASDDFFKFNDYEQNLLATSSSKKKK